VSAVVTYEFAFVVEGITVEAERDVCVVVDEFDGLLTSHLGRGLLLVGGEGRTASDAAQRLVARLRRALPHIRLLRLDPDLVGVSDIAERVGRSRQNVLQWVNGERRSEDPFPLPEGTVGRSLAWRWGDVHAWLARFGEGEEPRPLTREEALTVDIRLPGWQRTMDDGRPLVKMLVAQDSRARERTEVARALDGVLGDAQVQETVAALPRTEPERLVVVCAVLSDPLRTIIDEITPDDVCGLVAVRVETELRLIGVASRALCGTRPIGELGLSTAATVGDLVLALAGTERVSAGPLALA
jgi:predicted DNA-binding transcriptional regulator AlpA